MFKAKQICFSMCLFMTQLSFAEVNKPLDIQKIYVTLEQLLVDESGMYLNNSNRAVPITAIHHDNKGFFVNRDEMNEPYALYECPNGHPSRHGDGRCNQSKCPHYRN